MLLRTGFRFCSFNKGFCENRRPLIQIDNIIKILRPFDIEINIEEMVETVKIVGKYVIIIATVFRRSIHYINSHHVIIYSKSSLEYEFT